MAHEEPIDFMPSRLGVVVSILLGAAWALGWGAGAGEEGWPWYAAAAAALPGVVVLASGLRDLLRWVRGVPRLRLDHEGLRQPGRLVRWEDVVDIDVAVRRDPEATGWRLIVTYRDAPETITPSQTERTRKLTIPSYRLSGAPAGAGEMASIVMRVWRERTRSRAFAHA